MHHIIICLKYQVYTDIFRSKWCNRQRGTPSHEHQENHRGGFFRVAQRWQTASCCSETQRKARHQHAVDTPWHSPQAQTRHLPTPSVPTCSQRSPGSPLALPKKPKICTGAPFFLNVSQMEEKRAKKKGTVFLSKKKTMHFFCDVQLSSGTKQILQNTRLKQHAFGVDTLCVLSDFCISKLSRAHFQERDALLNRKSGPKRCPFRVPEGRRQPHTLH